MREGVGGALHVAKRFAQLKLGIRAPFDVISTRYEAVRGVRNIRPADPQDGATLITSWTHGFDGPVPMTDLKSLMLDRLFD